MTYPLNIYTFHINDSIEEIIKEMTDEQLLQLNKPSGLTSVCLLSDWWNQKTRIVEFSNTTNYEAIVKILTFYKHKTYNRMVGDHKFFEGLDDDRKVHPEFPTIHLGS